MTEPNDFEKLARQWMEMLQPPSSPNAAEAEFAQIQANAYTMVMQGMQAFASGFSEQATEHFRAAAAQASADPRIAALESRLAAVEAELAGLKAAVAARKPAAKPASRKPGTAAKNKG